MRHQLLSVGLLLLIGGTGCAATSEEPGDENASDEELNALSITLGGTADDVTVADHPRLTSSVREDIACAAGDRFEIDGRVRLGCKRGTEKLEVIVRSGEAVLVYRAKGRQSIYACTTSGNGPGSLPAKLACSLAHANTGGNGGLSSPFASTVPGIDIPNAHAVGTSGNLFRGMAPRSEQDFTQLVHAGIGAVLVFKNQTGNGTDVQDEIDKLVGLGLASSRVENIPFPYKDLPNYTDPCTQVVDALAFIKKNLAANKKTYFHCTVGEDRTGLLAAVERLTTEANLDATTAWDSEMCERGYGAGNPLKPTFVTGALEQGLKPLYRKLAYLVAKGRTLDASVCATDPSSEPDFEAKAPPADRLKCGTSTMFDPK